jgi:hypothetical protein
MTPQPPDWQDILRAAHSDPIDPAHYTAVRARVLAEIERGRNPWRRLAWLSGVAALTAALLLLRPAYRPELPPLPRIAVPGVARNLMAAAPPRHAPAVAMKRTPRPHREPLTIKLQTSDPNIVIYWIAD